MGSSGFYAPDFLSWFCIISFKRVLKFRIVSKYHWIEKKILNPLIHMICWEFVKKLYNISTEFFKNMACYLFKLYYKLLLYDNYGNSKMNNYPKWQIIQSNKISKIKITAAQFVFEKRKNFNWHLRFTSYTFCLYKLSSTNIHTLSIVVDCCCSCFKK